jgi:hypothetical protein
MSLLSAGEFGKRHRFLIVVARFNFSCSLIGNFRGPNSEEQNIGGNSMKIAMRMIVLTLVLSAFGFAQTATFSGPGMPPADPPVAAL